MKRDERGKIVKSTGKVTTVIKKIPTGQRRESGWLSRRWAFFRPADHSFLRRRVLPIEICLLKEILLWQNSYASLCANPTEIKNETTGVCKNNGGDDDGGSLGYGLRKRKKRRRRVSYNDEKRLSHRLNVSHVTVVIKLI